MTQQQADAARTTEIARRAIAAFLARERDMVEQKIEHLAEYSPFRHVESDEP
jgi:predicted N-acyltransferase